MGYDICEFNSLGAGKSILSIEYVSIIVFINKQPTSALHLTFDSLLSLDIGDDTTMESILFCVQKTYMV